MIFKKYVDLSDTKEWLTGNLPMQFTFKLRVYKNEDTYSGNCIDIFNVNDRVNGFLPGFYIVVFDNDFKILTEESFNIKYGNLL